MQIFNLRLEIIDNPKHDVDFDVLKRYTKRNISLSQNTYKIWILIILILRGLYDISIQRHVEPLDISTHDT
jgi:hypothetical protein